MILLLDTSQPACYLALHDDNGELIHEESWEVARELAEKLLGRIKQRLEEHNTDWHDVRGIGVFQGPGSFTGLRIGMSVVNALADDLSVPIVGAQNDDWRNIALKRLEDGDNDKIVLPFYGREANITTPRK